MLRLHPNYRSFDSELGLGTVIPDDVSIDLTQSAYLLLGRKSFTANQANTLQWSFILRTFKSTTQQSVSDDRTDWQKELFDAGSNHVLSKAIPLHPSDPNGNYISSLHALVRKSADGKTHIRPISHTSGTYVDNVRLPMGQWHELKDGQVVSFTSINGAVIDALTTGHANDALMKPATSARSENLKPERALIWMYQSDPTAPPVVAPNPITSWRAQFVASSKAAADASSDDTKKRKHPSDDDEEKSHGKKPKVIDLNSSTDDDDGDAVMLVATPPHPRRKEEPVAAAAAAARHANDESDDLLDCFICSQPMVKPHMLTCCQNNACHLCLVKHSRMKNDKNVPCPMACGRNIVVGASTLLNRRLDELIEKRMVQRGEGAEYKERAKKEALELIRLTRPLTHHMRQLTKKAACSMCRVQLPIGAPHITQVLPPPPAAAAAAASTTTTNQICICCYFANEASQTWKIGVAGDPNTTHPLLLYWLDTVRGSIQHGRLSALKLSR